MVAPSSTPTVFFDGECPICRREIDFYRGRRGADRIDWVDVSRCDRAALGSLAREKALRQLHVRTADGSIVAGAAAFAVLWQHLPGYAWLGHVAARQPARALLDGAYRAFLRVRPLWRSAAASNPGGGR